MLQSTYDTDADAMYLRLSEQAVARTQSFDEGTMVDVDADGEIVGIEVLRPARDWPLTQILDKYRLTAQDQGMLTALFGGRRLRTVPPSHDVHGMAQPVKANC